MNEMFLSVICAGAGLKKGANGKKCQENFEDRAAWVVLVGRFYVACDYIRAWYLIENIFCLYESVREKCEEGIEGRDGSGGHCVSWKET